MKKSFRLLAALSLLGLGQNALAQTSGPAQTMSQRMADAFISWHPDSILIGNRKTTRWDYEQGLMLKALERVWQRTGDAKYYTYILKDIDLFVQPNGVIRTYKLDDYNLDNLTTGHALLTLAQVSQGSQAAQEKYKQAAQTLRKQLDGQPRTKEGGFWHKKIYPNQMWLDGLYMAEPFYAEYSKVFNQPAGFDDVAKQFNLIEKHLVDAKTGLLYHGYDESKEQKWANKQTGQSPNFWDRGMGWYAMALVDVLDYFPANHPQRPQLIKYVQRLAPVLAKYQDPKTGTWSLVVDQGSRKGNYAEASGSSMFVYALTKGVRMGYLDKKYAAVAQKGYDGLLKTFVTTENNALAFNGTVSVGGLGGNPYRDGSYEYYLSEPLRKNDLKGVGPFILASIEMEIAKENSIGQNKTVGLDYYFNHEFRKNSFTGEQEQWHYTWEDRTHGGFWLLGNQFRELGAKTVSVPTAPTAASLKGIDVYIIVDPDSKKETAKPNYVQANDIKAISDWVKAGGTLVMMANDTSNCEIPHFNELAKAFGMSFIPKSLNMVKGDQFEQGRVDIPAGNAIFKHTKAAYIKELAPIGLQGNMGKALVSKGSDVIMATAKVGKGTVFVVGDPWLYNEYTDGRKIPAVYENFNAGKDLATWTLQQKAAK